MVYTATKLTIIPIVKLWIKKVNGIENIPKDRSFIVACNHSSYMDHMMLSSVFLPLLDKPVHYLAKKEHFEKGFQRLWHKFVQAIPIDRQTGGQEGLGRAVEYLKNGKIIGIYPEGTRTLTGKLQRAKTGVARLALAAKVPVLPIGIIGNFAILPKGKTIPKLRRAAINIGRLMHFDEYYGMENDPIVLRKVTTVIMKEIARLSNQEYDFD